jgi:LuxR family maltose regulon positive regulatory protein
VSAGLLALVRARLQRAHGDAAGASATIDEAVRDSAAPPWLRELIVAAGVALRTTNGTPPPVSGLSDAAPHSAVVRASARVTGGDAAGAREAVSALLQRADLPLDTQVAGWLVAAEAELAQGRPELARTALERALTLAAPERLRRPVVEASPALRRFFRQEREITERHGWLGAAITGPVETPRPARPLSTGRLVVEPLTDKETEVLRYLAALLSTDEIARKMFVSVNTVKTHVRGVLRKLAANRRNEAIRRARDLGLI